MNHARPDSIVAQAVRVGVNFGDHGETVWNSLEVGPNETVRALLERALPVRSYADSERYDGFVRLSFARREGVHAPAIYGDSDRCAHREGTEPCGAPADDPIHIATPSPRVVPEDTVRLVVERFGDPTGRGEIDQLLAQILLDLEIEP